LRFREYAEGKKRTNENTSRIVFGNMTPIEYDYVSSDPLTDFADDVKEPDDDVI
jgi:hypothetical protein